MGVIPFTGPSYTYISKNFDAQRSVNCYRVKSEAGTSKATYGMAGTPGRIQFAAVGNDGTRGAYTVNGRAFFAAATGLYEVLANGTSVLKGTLNTSTGPVAMSCNGLQLMAVDGPNGYVLQFLNTSSLISDGTFASANIVANGNFASNTIWSLGVGWTISGGQAIATGAISTPIYQTPTASLTYGDGYIISYTITVAAGSITPQIGNTVGTAQTTSGTYSQTLLSGSGTTLGFNTSGFTGTLDNVTVTPVDINWNQGTGWIIANNVATATSTSSALSQGVSLINGVPYQLTYTVTVSSGSITPLLAGTTGVKRTVSGTYTETIVAGNGQTFEFDPLSFTGVLTNVSVTQPNDAFLNVTDPYFMGSDTIGYIDGYFLLNKPGTSIWYLSNLFDGTSGDPLMAEQVEGFTDQLMAVHAVRNQAWLFGKSAIQIQYDYGGTTENTFPFTSLLGTYIEYGTGAAQSVCSAANTVLWLGSDHQGGGVIWMANGFQPQRVSTDAVEQAIQSYGDVSGAVAYSYQEAGHYFYCINFPSASSTWVYDINMDEWHERAYFNLTTGKFERDRAQCHVFCFNQHLVGDYEYGLVYAQSVNTYTDNGNPIRRLRAAPHLADDLENLIFNRVQIDMETGDGVATGNAADVNPMICLQWSDDGGHTWSNEHWRPVGSLGNYRTRAMWRMLGRSRDRVFRIIYTAATKFFIIAAHAEIKKGLN